MNTDRADSRKQWTQLLALAGAHFVLDCFPGLMHTVLPAFQHSFQLSVASGAVLLTVFLISANGIQVLIGHIRPEEDRPLLLYGGLLLACAIGLFALVPPGPMALLWLSLISVVSGAGIGMTHPEMLKAIHRLDKISSAVSSTVFMAGGVLGFALSGWASTHLFERYAFWSLAPYCIASLVVLGVVLMLGIRLAVERDEPARKSQQPQGAGVSFWMIMVIATLSGCSIQTLVWIIPQRAEELGLELTFGGVAVSVFSLAGGIGGIVLSRFAAKHGELCLIRRMLAAGTPLMILYLFFLSRQWSWILIFAAGFFCFGAYPLMVSLARHCEGPNLGRRMGLIVGGIWLVACLGPMVLGPVAKHFGTVPVLLCVPVGFVLSLALTLKRQK